MGFNGFMISTRPPQPLHGVLADGQRRGVFLPAETELMAHNPMVLAHSWALKNWRLTPTFTLEEYVENQLAMVLRSLLPPESWPDCPSRIKKYRPRRQPRRR